MTLNEHPGRPFGSIESSHEYLGMLLHAIEETSADIGENLRHPHPAGAGRRHEAFQLIAYKLEQLRFHLAISRRLLNDLRSLRRMLHGERSAVARGAEGTSGAPEAGAGQGLPPRRSHRSGG